MKNIPIEDATAPQLRHFAESTLGLTIHPNSNRETIIAKVQQAWDKPEIPVEDEAEAAPQTGKAPRPATAEQAKKPKKDMVRVFIAITEEPGGNEAVPVSVNGRAMLVPRNKEVEIPRPYFEVLQNAVKHVYDPLPDGNGINPVAREVPTYPVRQVA